jgi:aspartate racemase
MSAVRKVGILGGMGPAAGVDFVRLFLAACEAHLHARGQAIRDQAYPEHWMVQVPAPDRTAALLEGGLSPFPSMARALQGLQHEGVATVAIACNTAHAWHADMQRECPGIELLHIVQETTAQLVCEGITSIALLATLGTYRLGLYEGALQQAGIDCHLPRPDEQAAVMRGISEGVKAGDLALATALFTEVAARMVERHRCQAVVMACTEIPLALQALAGHPAVRLVNPAQVLAGVLAQRAYRGHGQQQLSAGAPGRLCETASSPRRDA